MKNSAKYYIQQAAASIVSLLVTNSMIQAYLLQSGINEERVATYLTAMQIVTAVITFLLTFFIDRIKNVLKMYSYLTLSQSVLIATLVFFCLNQNASTDVKFLSILSAGCISNTMMGISTVLGYKVPYHIINIEQYGVVSGRCGILVGIVGTVMSLIISLFQASFDYFSTMLYFLLFGAAMMIISFVTVLSYKPLPIALNSQRSKNKSQINILKYKPFYILLVPNLLRAYCEGIIFAGMTVGSLLGITDNSSGAVLTTISQVATLLGCVIFTLIVSRIKLGKIMLISSIFMLLAGPVMLTGNITLFYVMYFIVYIFDIFIQYSVPVAVTKIVDYNAIGQYTTFRMLFHTLGLVIANATVIPLVRAIGGPLTMLLATLGMLVLGIVYYAYMKKLKKG